MKKEIRITRYKDGVILCKFHNRRIYFHPTSDGYLIRFIRKMDKEEQPTRFAPAQEILPRNVIRTTLNLSEEAMALLVEVYMQHIKNKYGTKK